MDNPPQYFGPLMKERIRLNVSSCLVVRYIFSINNRPIILEESRSLIWFFSINNRPIIFRGVKVTSLIPNGAIAKGEIVVGDINYLVAKVTWVKSQSNCSAWTAMLLSRKSYILTTISSNFWVSVSIWSNGIKTWSSTISLSGEDGSLIGISMGRGWHWYILEEVLEKHPKL